MKAWFAILATVVTLLQVRSEMTKFTSGTCASHGCRTATHAQCHGSPAYCPSDGFCSVIGGCPKGCMSYFWNGSTYWKYNPGGSGSCTASCACHCDCSVSVDFDEIPKIGEAFFRDTDGGRSCCTQMKASNVCKFLGMEKHPDQAENQAKDSYRVTITKSYSMEQDCQSSYCTNFPNQYYKSCQVIRRFGVSFCLIEVYPQKDPVWKKIKCVYPSGRTSPWECTATTCSAEPVQQKAPEAPPAPKIDCKVSDWSAWDCNIHTGEETRERHIMEYPQNGGKACPTGPELEDERECDVNCEPGEWSDWTTCDKHIGEKERVRDPIVLRKHKGNRCRREFNTHLREEQKCPVDCEVGEWENNGEWSTCHSGKQERKRPRDVIPKNGGKLCTEENGLHLEEERNCDMDCEVGEWTKWTDCANGFRERTRPITQQQHNNGNHCLPAHNTHTTDTELCAIDCECKSPQPNGGFITTCDMPDWPATCVHGVQRRFITVTRHAENGGIACPDRQQEERLCGIDCEVSEWSPWSTCTGDMRQRSRYVKKQPMNNGRTCEELGLDKLVDNEHCPIHCKPGDWGDWSPCTVTCGAEGKTKREREVAVEHKFGGLSCIDPEHPEGGPWKMFDEKDCNLGECPKQSPMGMMPDTPHSIPCPNLEFIANKMCKKFDGALLRSDKTKCERPDGADMAEHCATTCCQCDEAKDGGPEENPDIQAECPGWADLGYCFHSFDDWMKHFCKQSCCVKYYLEG